MPENRIPTHPCEVLQEEFLKPMGISQTTFAKHIGISQQCLNEIVRGKRGISSDIAWRFSQALGTSPVFWMNLQIVHDLALSRPATSIERIQQ